jgi:hypothetical protein
VITDFKYEYDEPNEDSSVVELVIRREGNLESVVNERALAKFGLTTDQYRNESRIDIRREKLKKNDLVFIAESRKLRLYLRVLFSEMYIELTLVLVPVLP